VEVERAIQFESDLLKILIESVRAVSLELARLELEPLLKVRKLILSKAIEGCEENGDFNSDDKLLGGNILSRWLIIRRRTDGLSVPPEVFFGEEGVECQWPFGCAARSPTDVEKKFVTVYQEIIILSEIFKIQGDHLIPERWLGVDTVPMCALHNRQKQDALWPALVLSPGDL